MRGCNRLAVTAPTRALSSILNVPGSTPTSNARFNAAKIKERGAGSNYKSEGFMREKSKVSVKQKRLAVLAAAKNLLRSAFHRVIHRIAQVAALPPNGSKSQLDIEETDGIKISEQISWELNDANLPSRKKQKKTRIEEQIGDEWSKGRQKMVRKDRLIDRKNDRYKETIVDPDTNEVIHHCDEPLCQHTGHGSAKKPRRQ